MCCQMLARHMGVNLFYRATVEASDKPGKVTGPCFFIWRDSMKKRYR